MNNAHRDKHTLSEIPRFTQYPYRDREPGHGDLVKRMTDMTPARLEYDLTRMGIGENGDEPKSN